MKAPKRETVEKRVRQRLDTFEGYVRADEFKGAARPDDQDVIEAKYKTSRRALEKFIVEALCRTS